MPGPTPVVHISAESIPHQAIVDLADGLNLYGVWGRLAYHDIRQRFRRSVLGPFWLTLSMGIMIGAMGLIFSTLFHQDAAQTLPFIATGIIFWSLLTACINEGSAVFIAAEAFLQNVPMPVSVHVYRMLARNVLIWVFNMAIYVAVAAMFRVSPGWDVLLFVPGFALFLANAAWMSLACGIVSTRYRDIPQVITNLIQVVFYITPVFWSPASLDESAQRFVDLNPFYHLLEIVRAPLLGQAPAPMSWIASAGLALVGIALTTWLYRRAHARIAYWV